MKMTPKRTPTVSGWMQSSRRNRRGLAEIVGTLMLVVIVVAAATAFSFFVAAYQKELQSQETMTHDRELEDLKVIDVSETTCQNFTRGCASGSALPGSFAEISFLVASLDVNAMWLTGLFLNGGGIVNYTATYHNHTIVDPCYDGSTTSGVNGLVPCAALSLPSYSTVLISLDLDGNVPYAAAAFGGTNDLILPTSVLDFQILTLLTNLFTESFTPPDAIASVFYVSNGTAPVAVFDGLESFQPSSANNASILGYSWDFVNTSTPAVVAEQLSGAEVEWPAKLPPGMYDVTLSVTDTDGLTGTTTLAYNQIAT